MASAIRSELSRPIRERRIETVALILALVATGSPSRIITAIRKFGLHAIVNSCERTSNRKGDLKWASFWAKWQS